MSGIAVEWWLMLQLLIETGLCVLIIYYIYGAKNLRSEIMLEQEKMRTVVDSLRQQIKKSDQLDKQRQKVLELCAKIKEKGSLPEMHIDHCGKNFKHFPKRPGDGATDEEKDSCAHAYEKVSSLIEKGLSAHEISRKLGLSQGEVELVINLKRQ